MLRSSSDRAKVAVSLCAIASSAMTLAAYFHLFDHAAPPSVHAASIGASPFESDAKGDAALFPAGISEFANTPAASS